MASCAAALSKELRSPTAFGSYKVVIAGDTELQERVYEEAISMLLAKFRSRVESMCLEATTVMHRTFEHVLTHTNDGTIRFFATPQGLNKVYPIAKHAGLVALACIAFFRIERDGLVEGLPQLQISADDVNPPQIAPLIDGQEKQLLLSQAMVTRAFDAFVAKAEVTLQMQRRAVESGYSNIPLWFWIVLAVLGYDELLYVLTSPVLLLFLILIVYVFFRHWAAVQWQRFEETGPQRLVLPMKAVVSAARPYLERLAGDVSQKPSASKKIE